MHCTMLDIEDVYWLSTLECDDDFCCGNCRDCYLHACRHNETKINRDWMYKECHKDTRHPCVTRDDRRLRV